MQFSELLTEYRIPFYDTGSKTRPGWLNFRCLWCGKDPYLGFNILGRYLSCWSCGYHRLCDGIAKITGLPYRECNRIIGEMPHTELPPESYVEGKLEEPDGLIGLSTYHRDYLSQRGFDPDKLVELWGIGGIGQLGRLGMKWRIYIPIHYRGEVVSWTTRAMGDTEPRYWSARDDQSKIPIDRCIYGIDYCRTVVVLVEGPTDAWAIGPGAAAIMGLNANPDRLAQIADIPTRYVCFDNEPDAQMRARKLIRSLSVFDGTTLNLRLDAKDPASASEKELESLRQLVR
jgi:hypothetical protein